MGRRAGDAYFCFINKDSPEYEPSYGKTYTERQFAILSGNIPLEEVRVNELTLLSRKAFQNGDIDTYEVAKELLSSKQYPNTYSPSYTIEEAKEILQALTPWKIDWGDSS